VVVVNIENQEEAKPNTENIPATPPNTIKIKIKKCVEPVKLFHKNNLI
jgi:hypothetical protein